VAGTKLWGYEAALPAAAIGQWDIGTDTFDTSCVPPSTLNGRGIAYDPIDGNLWYTRVATFAGDGFIHKATLPPACAAVPSILFGDGLGGAIQDDVGALDIDPDDGHIWAAGYAPVAGSSFLYKVDRVTGAILTSCSVPFGGGGVGNDTLAVAKLSGLGGSGKYLLTDAGELLTSLHAVDAASCVGGGPGTITTTFTLPVGVSGIDYEGGQLIATTGTTINDLGAPPFGVVGATMPTAPGPFFLEDITLQTAPIVLEVDIDIKPGSFPNSIKLSNKGVIPVAILSTTTFDATTVDPSTVCFGDAEAPLQRDCTEAHGTGHVEDVNGDLLLDLVLHYETSETGIDFGDTEACLTGQTFGGQQVAGCDSVRTL
jgi:hypothetical protein